MSNLTLEKLTNFCKDNGFIFSGSEIYGGLANTWDFGPVGVEIFENLKRAWWKTFVQQNDNTFGVDASIFMNSKVWEASGHVGSFNDPKVDCKSCKARHRADNLIEAHSKNTVDADALTYEQMDQYIKDKKVVCPKCGKADFTVTRKFSQMLNTTTGVTDENQNLIYLRPETAQGQFVNFLNVQRTMRAKVPFGIAQIGKAFRNEVTPGNFLFRTFEFTQMEHQLFCHSKDAMDFYELYKQRALNFLLSIGVKKENLRFKDHSKLSHYAKAACDIQYNFPMGWQELNGIHHRSAFDLTQHSQFSGKSLEYFDPFTNEKYIPTVIENSIGATRLFMAVVSDAYNQEKKENGEERIVLKIHPAIAPYKVAVLPLIKKNHGEKAKEVVGALNKNFMVATDEAGSIGKRYSRQDEIGTPFCLTIDEESLTKNTYTLRERDSMKQERLTLDQIILKVLKSTTL
ncbi:MAG: glycine--tRNA ligase [Firmicutes bacterium]|nr:glycine--tRNA ligase [Bacillota bacterium]